MAWDADFFYEAYPRVEEAFLARLDEDLAPRDPSVLLQVVRELGVRPDARAVDVGCGSGHHAFRLAAHFGLQVLGIDPVQRHLDLAREARRGQPEEIAGRVSFERGSAVDIPVRDASLDLVWCRDALVHEPDLEGAWAEFERVLRPGGHVVNYQMVATPALPREEGRWLFEVMGVVPSSADAAALDEAIQGSGLEAVDCIDLSSEWGEWSWEQGGRARTALLHLARLRRDPQRYRAEFGDRAYDVMLGETLWHVHRMSGGLAGRIDVCRKP